MTIPSTRTSFEETNSVPGTTGEIQDPQFIAGNQTDTIVLLILLLQGQSPKDVPLIAHNDCSMLA